MKLFATFAFMILGTGVTAFAEVPNPVELIQSLDHYYSGNSKYQLCLEELNAGKPISLPVAYLNRLAAASFAEGLTASCK